MDIKVSGLKAKVTYSIVTRVRRPGILSRWLKTSREIIFVPPVRPMLLKSSPNLDLGRFPYLVRNVAMLPASRLGASTDLSLLPGCLPPYSPALTLEVLMSHPPVLMPGKSCSLQISLCSSSSLVESVGPVQMRNVIVRLRSRTKGRISSFVRADTSYRTMWSIIGNVPIGRGKFEVDLRSMARTTIYQPTYLPSSPASSRETTLIEVTVGISSQREQAIQVRRSLFIFSFCSLFQLC